MSSDPSHGLEAFVQNFFTSQGAEVEACGSRLDILSPQDLARRIGIPDFCSIKIGPQETDGYAVHYGSPLLEKIAQAACEKIPFTFVRLSFHYIKSQGFDKLMRDLFTFHGARVRVEKTAQVQTEYLLLTCRYLAQSDEQKEGLLPLAFNLETGAPIDNIDTMLDLTEKKPEAGGPFTAFEEGKTYRIIQWVQRRAAKVMDAQIHAFRDSMNRRFSRDVANLEAYYAELKREMAQKLERPGLSEQSIHERKDKIRLIPDEVEKKKHDLFKKYSIKVKFKLSGAMLIRTPAVKLLCNATIGRRQKPLSFSYNPIDKSLDPLVCSGCGDGTYHLYFCHHLHLLCPLCVPKCPLCS
ncbi:MAG: hypothetical protein PVG01_07765 [Desulfobacterales bacterium]|jgi:hypothetical protein